MRSLATAICVLASWANALAADAIPRVADVRAATDRGLAFLAKDALAWKAKHNCASCHHASLVVWSMREAKQRGHAIDEAVLSDLAKWMTESGEGKNNLVRPAGAPKAFNSKALYYALALGTDPQPNETSQSALKLLLNTVKSDQIENGSWQAWPETRPPIFGNSDESLTALEILALLPAANSGDESAKAARDKGVQWLIDTKSDNDPQSIALRLILWKRLDRPADECVPLIENIKQRQNPDGGWSQSKEMASDAWATGQALYALALAGLKADDPVIARGHTFLIKTQHDDGSWPMTSRPTTPGGAGSTSLIPIIGAGSAWAVLGLAHSS